MVYCVTSLESPQWGDSNENTQNTFTVKENQDDTLIMPPGLSLWLTLISSNYPSQTYLHGSKGFEFLLYVIGMDLTIFFWKFADVICVICFGTSSI